MYESSTASHYSGLKVMLYEIIDFEISPSTLHAWSILEVSMYEPIALGIPKPMTPLWFEAYFSSFNGLDKD